MALQHRPAPSATAAPTTTTPAPQYGTGTNRVLAILRVATGFVFLWAFIDKTFGLGYATPSERAWINGGSPTRGFLSGVEVGPFDDIFRSWAGTPWANWLFMLGLLGIGLALVLGVALRIAAVSGTLMMVFMWAAEFPPDRFTNAGEPSMSTNPIFDYHLAYALIMIVLALTFAGATWGLGKWWASLELVQKNRWLL